jgi:hypothetical protein
MLAQHFPRPLERAPQAWFPAGLTLLTAFALSFTGCTAPLAKHTAAVALATRPVVDQASEAYRSANAIHRLALQYDAYTQFQAHAKSPAAPAYNPRSIQPLLSDSDIDTRLAVLAAFQLYVRDLAELSDGTDSPELREASRSVGASLSSFGNTLAPSIEGGLGIAPPVITSAPITVTSTSAGATTSTTSTTSKPGVLFTPSVSNGISTAVEALGQFLASRKIDKELPTIVIQMDLKLQPLWTLMENDVALLLDQENRDYDTILDGQKGFLLENPNLQPDERREEIMKFPGIVEQQRDSVKQLARLHDAILRLALAHHALAEAAQSNAPESLKSKLSDLETAGSNLGKFYASLPSH